jgi:predicted type IV restriction endonuclease
VIIKNNPREDAVKEQIIKLASEINEKIHKKNSDVKTEEHTKQFFIEPFLKILGYDLNDSNDIIREHDADDRGGKKWKKVDYLIKVNDSPAILIECKFWGYPLSTNHENQLRQYFVGVRDACYAILTNGIVYKFYTDLEKPNTNIMDNDPFFEFDLSQVDNLRDEDYDTLKKFTKNLFSEKEILTTAKELKMIRSIKQVLEESLMRPLKYNARLPEDFMRHIFNGMQYKKSKHFNANTKKILEPMIKSRIKEVVRDINCWNTNLLNSDGIVTTPEEVEAYYIIKAIAVDIRKVQPEWIEMHDVKTYCTIYFNNGISKQKICRLHFETRKKWITLFDNADECYEKLDSVDEVFKYKKRIQATIKRYI